MKYLYIWVFIVQSLLLAQQTPSKTQQNIQKQLEREKKYVQEQRFYSGEEYDLKSHEVDKETLKSLPDVPNHNEDFDMNDVYD
jgi:hypothetical protein